MKKKQIILFSLALLATVALTFFATKSLYSKGKPTAEEWMNQSLILDLEPTFDSLETKELLNIDGRSIRFKDLPLEIKKDIKREEILAHERVKAIMKGYLAQFNNQYKKVKDVYAVDLLSLPKISPAPNKEEVMKKVDKIYTENVARLPKDHNVQDVRRQILFEVVSDETLKYTLSLLRDAHNNLTISYPRAPSIPIEWLVNDGALTYGDEKAPHHIIWVSNYGCTFCESFNQDLTLLIQKYKLSNFKITFIPWSKNEVDAHSLINLYGRCTEKVEGNKTFWRFHSLAMGSSRTIFDLRPGEFDKAKTFVSKIFEKLNLSKDSIDAIEKCSSPINEKNQTLVDLTVGKRLLEPLVDVVPPTIFFDGQLLDLEGRSLYKTISQRLDGFKKK